MKNNLLKYILVVSLLLNFSLLGTAAFTHYRQTRFGPPPMVGLISGPVHPGPFAPGMFFEELSLKPEQVKLFQEKAALFHRALREKSREVGQERASLIDLMRADHPDTRAIEAAISRINKIQEDIQKMGVSHMLEFKSMLNKDQQKKFLDLIGEAMTRRGGEVCP